VRSRRHGSRGRRVAVDLVDERRQELDVLVGCVGIQVLVRQRDQAREFGRAGRGRDALGVIAVEAAVAQVLRFPLRVVFMSAPEERLHIEPP
jgi:hypothetical protein